MQRIDELRAPGFWTDEQRWLDVTADLPAYRLSKFQDAMPDWVRREVVGLRSGFLRTKPLRATPQKHLPLIRARHRLPLLSRAASRPSSFACLASSRLFPSAITAASH